MHHQTQVRVLKDPDNMLRGADEATTLLRKGADLYSDEVAIDTLKNVYLGNDAISEIDYYMYQGQTALEAAEQWIQKKFGGIESYINHLATSLK